jgi:hypothetical protein
MTGAAWLGFAAAGVVSRAQTRRARRQAGGDERADENAAGDAQRW